MALAAILACLSYLLLSFSAEASYGGFTVDLIQRDSPLSPWYDSSTTHFDSLHNAFCRSISRAHRFIKPSTNTIQSKIVPSGGEYLMNISIGTPPVEVLGIADTGSDLIWTQCKPCTQCFNQNPPLFDPKRSSTYRTVPCQSNSCSNLEEASCGADHGDTCVYSYRYGDRSFTGGSLAQETFTIGSAYGRPVSLPKIIFGCGHENGGTFDESGSGLIGLGAGPLSFISQLNGGKFSYCLVPTSAKSSVASKISFGTAGIVSGNGAQLLYVGEKRLSYKTSQSTKAVAASDGSEGNIIIDSGTTLTLLPPGFYNDVVSALEVTINAERVSDPKGVLSLCFRSKSDHDIDVPVITAHFSGADVKLNALNTFARVEDDMVCFTMIPSDDVAIFGNLVQMNFLVGYDLEERTVSFKPADCTKH
ncbi:aspartic proteinase CDR1-like [Rosa sericea]